MKYQTWIPFILSQELPLFLFVTRVELRHMKKILFLLAFSMIIPSVSFATSGACSYHSGVNCSAGASNTGRVQCNDGWINSSVYFYDAQECKTSSCVYPMYSSCDVEYAKQQAQAKIDNLNFMKARGSLVQGPSDCTQDTNYALCKSTQALYQSGLDYYNKCLKDENSAYVEKAKQTDTEYQIKFNTACASITGIGSVYTKDGCIAPLKITTSSLPDAVVNKEYSTDIKFTYDDKVKEIPVLNLSSLPESFYSASMNSNGYYGVFPVRLTPRKLGKFTFNADVSINGAPVTSKVFTLNVVGENKVEALTATSATAVATTTNFFFSAPSNLTEVTTFRRTMKKGMSGDDVKQLQLLLQKLKYLSTTQELSTYFGPLTNNAIIKFQKDNKIQPATGTFGPATQAKLLSLTK
jgi:Putative peptidoglycan binding domain